jgi:hypothetical protein
VTTCERTIALYADTCTVLVDGIISQTTKKQQTCAHWSTKGKRWNCELNTLVGRKVIDTLPEGRRSEAFCVPLKIWSNTGTEG